MKKILLIAVVTLFSVTLFAQMTLEHTFNNHPYTYGKKWSSIITQPDVAYYYFANKESNNVEFYSSDNFNLIESLHVQIADSFTISRVNFLPVGLYKNDNNTYFVVSYNAPSYGNNHSTLAVFKKSGNNLISEQIIATGSNATYSGTYFNGTRWLATIWTSNDENYSNYHIYSFAGTYTGTDQIQANNGSMMPYPNPSRDNIHLTFEEVKEVSSIRIFNVNGRMIERIPVGNGMSEFLLDVHSYPEGVYFYEIDGKSQSFMVK